MRKSLTAVTTMVAVAVLATASPAGAAATKTLALWNMNEKPGAKVLIDSGGHAIKGTIGSHVVLNGSHESFPVVKGGIGGVVDPAHIDLVNSALGYRSQGMFWSAVLVLALTPRGACAAA